MPAPRPPRMTMGNLDSGVTLSAQYNPEQLEETVKAVYQKSKVQGLSHEVHQFQHTASHELSFDLAFDGLSSEAYDILQARRWLLSLTVPTRGAGNVVAGGPPHCLFYWPGMFSLAAVVEELKFKHKRFSWTGLDLTTTWYVVTVKLAEVRETRLFSDEVAAMGTVRTSK